MDSSLNSGKIIVMATVDPAQRQARVVSELQRMYALKTGGGGLLVAAGAAVIIIGGMVLVSVLCFILWNFFDSTWIGWKWWFIVYLAIVVPLLIREDKRSRGEYLSDAAGGLSNPASASSYGESQWDRLQVGGVVITEVLFWGPRSLIQGLSILRGQQTTRFKPLIERAAKVVLQLYDDPDPLPMKKLIQPGDSPMQLGKVLKWLDDNDHIGLSTDKSRVWLASKLRAQLQREGY